MSISIPEGFPASTVDLQTALTGVAIQAPEKLVTLAETFFSIFWAEGNTKITNPEVFQPILQRELAQSKASEMVSQNSTLNLYLILASQNNYETSNVFLLFFLFRQVSSRRKSYTRTQESPLTLVHLAFHGSSVRIQRAKQRDSGELTI